ncbi:DUF4252 domain-containing protein [Fulvivirgaceae bacterium BMA10]|uniref:DUF4252 domain-containing protein n=1 Tax=Splendidivirga corallicola TaxID=3051826 RepID=A0ABT8KIB4_9BACT|nr:DUF4252 domain-containing protein [Fulvivirgaceae bacterium BMA10]
MKKIFITISIAFMSTMTVAQSNTDAIIKFFDKYMDDDDFTTIYISGKMFGIMSEIPMDDDEEYIRQQLNDLTGLRILTSDHVDGVRLYNEVYDKLNTNGYEELMVVREGDEEFKFLVKESKGIIKELLMLSGHDNEFFLMSLLGIIDIKTIAKISKSMDIDGLDKLDRLDRN